MQLLSTLVAVGSLVSVASAHATVYGLWVNGAFQGDGRNSYIRSPPNNNPVKDISGTQINCNVNNRNVGSSVSAKAGDSITFEWHHNSRGDDIIAASHKGPIVVYIAASSSNGNGAVWSKLCQDGLSGGQWAVDKLISNGGKHSCTLPSALAPGDYLLRAEIIAHHESETSYSTDSARGTQFYPSCSQVKVTSGGSAVPNQNFNFVGGYKYSDPGILFNLYSNPTSYSIPGPSIWQPSSGGTTNPGGSGTVAKYGQCGGIGYTGATQCASSTCVKVNDYYSQCQ